MAWLNATPKPAEGSKRAKADNQPPPVSRVEQMKRDGIVPAMPSNPAPHILARLLEIGLTEVAGMGAGPISWQSIKGWQDAMGIHLARWEIRLLRKLSMEYLTEGRRAEDENCPPPWRAPVTEREKQVEVEKLRMLLG